MKERLYKKQNFLRVKGWLATQLQDYAEVNNKEYKTVKQIIEEAKEDENLLNSLINEDTSKQGDKAKVDDKKVETGKNK